MLQLRSLSIFLVAFGLCTCGTGDALDRDDRERLDELWRLYQSQDPEWPDARDRWYGSGGAERETLVLSLIRDLVHRAPTPVQTARGLEPGWKRPQRELLSLPRETTVDFLVVALRTGRDPASLGPLADTLAGFGAVTEIVDALDHPNSGDSPQFAGYAMFSLVQAGGDQAIARVAQELRTAREWTVRSRAAEALGNARYTDQDRAVVALLGGLEDDERFVVRKTLEALWQLDRADAAPAIAAFLGEAVESGRDEEAGLAVITLKKLTGAQVPGDDPAVWRLEAQSAAARAKR